SLHALHQRSIEDPEWFWDAVAKDIGIAWMAPYRRVLDESRGIAWPRWFEGGRLNLAANCVDRHLAERRDRPAAIYGPETCEAKVLITADGFHRRGQLVRMKQTADEAAALSPSVRHLLVVRRLGGDVPWTSGRDRWWHEAVEGQSTECPPVAVEADRPCLII